MNRNQLFGLFCGLLFGLNSLASAEQNPWEDFQPLAAKPLAERSVQQTEVAVASHQKARMLRLNESMMRSALVGSALEGDLARKSIADDFLQVLLPLANGSNVTVNIEPTYLLPRQLSEKYPEIKTYRVLPDAFVSSGRVDMTPSGFHALIQTREGDTFFIDPTGSLDINTSKRIYTSYRKQDQKQSREDTFSCGAKPSSSKFNFLKREEPLLSQKLTDTKRSLITYKIAIATTGEYTAKHGGTKASALAAVVTTINRINQVYEHDLGIRLILIENNDQIIYTRADSDPYTTKNLHDLLTINRENINSIIGVENYDIGHLFTTSGGGLAAIAGVCSEFRKAQGVSGISNPVNDSFNLEFVAHEIGHQLGATHTFNGKEGLCSGGTRAKNTAFEPGSGSTIMSYAGHCGADNLQSSSDAMFHIGSINQIRDFTTNNRGQYCGDHSQAENTPPSVEAGNNYVIPSRTPFLLSGSATDIDNDQLVYAWEQVDSGERSGTLDDTGDNALFRVRLPSSNQTRSFPPLQNILSHTIEKGEILPFQQRILKFSFVAQDSFNAAQSDNMSIQVLRTGSRFALNLPRASYARGDTHKILWNVANTDKHPINCTNVDVALSSNGGTRFDQVLAQNIPNTGEAWVTISAGSPLSNQGRFKISCSDNVFFAISFRNFVISEQGDTSIASLDDEDQPELLLADKDIVQSEGENADIKEAQESSGGSFGVSSILAFLLLLFFKEFSNRRVSIVLTAIG